MNYREQLRTLLRMKSWEARGVTLSSGRESSHYFDCKKVTLTGCGSYLCAVLFHEMIKETDEMFNVYFDKVRQICIEMGYEFPLRH